MPPPRPLQPVVIWFGRVGDMIMLSALLEILHRRYGRPCCLIGAGSWSAEIYAAHPHVQRVLWIRRYTLFLLDPRWWQLVWALRRNRAAPVYVCETDARKLARIRRFLQASGTPEACCVFLTQDAASLAHPHWVDRLVSLGHATPAAIAAAEYPWPVPEPSCTPELVVSPAARAAGEAWARRNRVGGRPLVLLQPGNRRTMRGRGLKVKDSDDRFWPVERWAELIHRIHERLPEARIVLCGAPRERVLLDWIESAAARPQVLLRGLPFPGLFDLCRRAHSMISIDTGTAHAAAALGLPLVVLFGATPPEQVWPRSARGATPVLGVGGRPRASRVDQLAVSEVFDTWCRLLEEIGRAPGALTPAASASAR